jgi:hypothetical protein
MLSFLSLLAFEREADGALVIAAGIPEAWLTEGVRLQDLPTHYGKLSYTLRQNAPDRLRVSLAGNLAMAPGNIVIKLPLTVPLEQVEVNGECRHTSDAENIVIDCCPAEIIPETRDRAIAPLVIIAASLRSAPCAAR